jgi:hypothetical protein
MIEAIHRANISVQDKLSALVRATRRDKDKMLKSIFSFASYLPRTYYKVVCDLEDYYGGDKRALDHVKNELFDGTVLVWDDIEKVAIVRSKIDTFLSHCTQHRLVGVIDNDVLTDLVLNQMFTHKQVLQYRNDCRIFQFTHPDLLRSISEWLRMRIDDLSWADGRIHSLHKSGTRKVKTKASTSALAMTYQDQEPDEESPRAAITRAEGTQNLPNPVAEDPPRAATSGAERSRRTYKVSTASGARAASVESEPEKPRRRAMVAKADKSLPARRMPGKTLVNTLRLDTSEDSSQSESEGGNEGSDITVSHGDVSSDPDRGFTMLSSGFKAPECSLCDKGRHFLYGCPDFMKMDVANRIKATSDNKRCFNCLSSSHKTSECKSKFSCKHCKKNHHSLLHKGKLPGS